jgi:hypothetical protein
VTRLVAIAAVASVAVVALVGLAAARPRDGTVAILSLQISGDGDPELGSELHRSLAGGLAAGGMRVVGLNDVNVALRDAPELRDCSSTTCLTRIGEKVGAGYFARVRVDVAGSAYTVEIELLSARVEGALVKRVEQTCPVCTIMEVNDLVSAAAKDLVVLPPAQPVPIAIESDPPGALVLLDEVEVGRTPLRTLIEPGDHVVVARLEDHHDAEKRIRVAETGPEPQVFALALAPRRSLESAPVDAPAPPVRRFRSWKWAAGGAALAALAGGATLMVLDGANTCDRAPGQTQCEEVRDTMTLGLVTVGVGAALGGVSLWMFAKDRQAVGRARVDVAAGAAAATAVLTIAY